MNIFKPSFRKNGLVLLIIFMLHSTFAQDSPNVVLFIADDLGVDALNGYSIGNIKPATPHLDSLRAVGITFNNVWSAPVCSPTRACMLTGKYGINNGVTTVPQNLDTAHTSLFDELKENSTQKYTSCAVGKWHLAFPEVANHPNMHGADHFVGSLGTKWDAYDDWVRTENGVSAKTTAYATSHFTTEAIDWIKEQSQPWLVWMAHFSPHTPMHVPPSYMFTQSVTSSNFYKYLAMIESLDYEIGRFIDLLPQETKENTVFIFVGDNGTPGNVIQGYASNHGKQTLYQGGIHVPMIIAGKGVTRHGEEENALVHVVDLYATIMDIADENRPGEKNGKYNSLSFKHLLNGSDGPTRTYNYAEITSNLKNVTTDGYTIRNERYKLIVYTNGTRELYDLSTDKLETNDLMAGSLTSEQSALVSELLEESEAIRNGWSCNDNIQNGDETSADCGGTVCPACNTSVLRHMDGTDEMFIVSPNPVKNKLVVQRAGALSPSGWTAELIAMSGKVIINKEFPVGSPVLEFNLENIEPQELILRFINHETHELYTQTCIKIN